jgi:hypothetical protein
MIKLMAEALYPISSTVLKLTGVMINSEATLKWTLLPLSSSRVYMP